MDNNDYDRPTELYDPRLHGQRPADPWQSPQAAGRANRKTEVLQPKGPRIFAMLVGVEGVPSMIGQLFRLDATADNLLGRDYACDIVIDEPAVSRQQAKIKLEPDTNDSYQFFIQDLATDNGVEVNGKPVIKHYLSDGDRIKVGRNVLVFKWVNESR
jgi:pSer/pThr/pTyr-binding forkhead associated (FHA) protein